VHPCFLCGPSNHTRYVPRLSFPHDHHEANQKLRESQACPGGLDDSHPMKSYLRWSRICNVSAALNLMDRESIYHDVHVDPRRYTFSAMSHAYLKASSPMHALRQSSRTWYHRIRPGFPLCACVHLLAKVVCTSRFLLNVSCCMLVDDESRPGLTFQTPSKPSKLVVGATLAAPYIINGPQSQIVLTFGVLVEDTIEAAHIKLGIQIVSARGASMFITVDVTEIVGEERMRKARGLGAV
jgi:hypothetical protein